MRRSRAGIDEGERRTVEQAAAEEDGCAHVAERQRHSIGRSERARDKDARKVKPKTA